MKVRLVLDQVGQCSEISQRRSSDGPLVLVHEEMSYVEDFFPSEAAG
jgi:hypothetical protein